MASGGELSLSPNHVDSGGALPNTLAQLYTEGVASTAQLGWFFYNDENPITGRTNGTRGHTEEVLAFDLATTRLCGRPMLDRVSKFIRRAGVRPPLAGNRLKAEPQVC
jgi:Deoxyribonuclease II